MAAQPVRECDVVRQQLLGIAATAQPVPLCIFAPVEPSLRRRGHRKSGSSTSSIIAASASGSTPRAYQTRSVRGVETVFDSDVDPDLVERSLAASTFGSVWLDIPRPEYPKLTGSVTGDLLVVGAGYTGLWTALQAAQRNPDQRIVLIDAERVGWAASGRNGGFVDASLTHGLENGKSRWPNEIDKLKAMGRDNLDGMQADIQRLGLDVDWQRTGMLSVATEPHQVAWLQQAARDGEGRFLALAEVRQEVRRRRTWRACSAPIPRDRPSRQAGVRTRPRLQEAGVRIHEHTDAR